MAELLIFATCTTVVVGATITKYQIEKKKFELLSSTALILTQWTQIPTKLCKYEGVCFSLSVSVGITVNYLA